MGPIEAAAGGARLLHAYFSSIGREFDGVECAHMHAHMNVSFAGMILRHSPDSGLARSTYFHNFFA